MILNLTRQEVEEKIRSTYIVNKINVSDLSERYSLISLATLLVRCIELLEEDEEIITINDDQRTRLYLHIISYMADNVYKTESNLLFLDNIFDNLPKIMELADGIYYPPVFEEK